MTQGYGDLLMMTRRSKESSVEAQLGAFPLSLAIFIGGEPRLKVAATTCVMAIVANISKDAALQRYTTYATLTRFRSTKRLLHAALKR